MSRWGWLFVWLGWIGLYVALSSQIGSSENSSAWLLHLLRAISPALAEQFTPEMLSALNFVVRKGAHFCGFAILTYLGYGMFHHSLRLPSGRALRWAVGTSFVRALLDEFQQSFVPGRTATLMDVGIDAGGILLMAFWLLRRIATRQPP